MNEKSARKQFSNVFTLFAFLRNEREEDGKLCRTRWKVSININKNERKKAIFLPISTHKTVYTQFLMPLHFVLPHISPNHSTGYFLRKVFDIGMWTVTGKKTLNLPFVCKLTENGLSKKKMEKNLFR